MLILPLSSRSMCMPRSLVIACVLYLEASCSGASKVMMGGVCGNTTTTAKSHSTQTEKRKTEKGEQSRSKTCRYIRVELLSPVATLPSPCYGGVTQAHQAILNSLVNMKGPSFLATLCLLLTSTNGASTKKKRRKVHNPRPKPQPSKFIRRVAELFRVESHPCRRCGVA